MLVSQPWFDRLTPIVSLGAGVLHANVDGEPTDVTSQLPAGARPVSAFALAPIAGGMAQSATTFALSPAIGAKLTIWRDLGLRADVRDLVTFRNGTRHNVQFTAGFSLPF